MFRGKTKIFQLSVIQKQICVPQKIERFHKSITLARISKASLKTKARITRIFCIFINFTQFPWELSWSLLSLPNVPNLYWLQVDHGNSTNSQAVASKQDQSKTFLKNSELARFKFATKRPWRTIKEYSSKKRKTVKIVVKFIFQLCCFLLFSFNWKLIWFVLNFCLTSFKTSILIWLPMLVWNFHVRLLLFYDQWPVYRLA